jgi:hypothetical protein
VLSSKEGVEDALGPGISERSGTLISPSNLWLREKKKTLILWVVKSNQEKVTDKKELTVGKRSAAEIRKEFLP